MSPIPTLRRTLVCSLLGAPPLRRTTVVALHQHVLGAIVGAPPLPGRTRLRRATAVALCEDLALLAAWRRNFPDDEIHVHSHK